METHPMITTLRQAVDGLLAGVAPQAGACESGDVYAMVRGLSGAELLEVIGLAERLGRVVDMLRLQVAAEADARTQKKPDKPEDSFAHTYGFGSAVELLKHLTLVSGASLSRRVRQVTPCQPRVSLHGEVFPGKYPHIGAAFRQGLLSRDAVEVLVSRFQKLPSTVPVERVDYVERVLVSHATGIAFTEDAFTDLGEGVPQGSAGVALHADDLRQLADMWMTVLDQEGVAPKAEQVARRFFRIGAEREGLVRVSGALLPEVAASLGRVIDAVTNPRTTRTRNTGHDGVEEDPDHASRVRFGDTDSTGTLVQDTRTPDQKRHDVLATIIQVAMKHDDMPQLGGEALSLTIQVTEENLTDPAGIAWMHDHTGALTAVDAGAARHAGCVGSILRVTQAGNGRIVGLETHKRVFTAKQRKAIMLRDGGCIIPGCGHNPVWCEIHHVIEWQDGGNTHTDNGVLLCWYHHRYLETHGWDIRMVDGIPEVKAPAWIDPAQTWRPARSVHKQPDPPHSWQQPRQPWQQSPARTLNCRVQDTGMHLAPAPDTTTPAGRVSRLMDAMTRPPGRQSRQAWSPRRMDYTTGPPAHINYAT